MYFLVIFDADSIQKTIFIQGKAIFFLTNLKSFLVKNVQMFLKVGCVSRKNLNVNLLTYKYTK